MNFKALFKFTSIVVVATTLVLGRIFINRNVRACDDDDKECAPFLNVDDSDVIDPIEEEYHFPELITGRLRQTLVQVYSESWKGYCRDWSAFMRLRIAGSIASGSYGQVSAAFDDDGGEVAIKSIHKDALSFRGQNFIKRELEIMSSLNHPNLLPILASFSNESVVSIVMDRAKYGNAKDLLRSNDDWLKEALVAKIMACTARGLEFMHRKGVFHRDMKLENLLITSWKPFLVVKISDFGEAERRGTGEHNGFIGGTAGYCSPEYIQGRAYGSSINMWSLGICLYHLLFGYLPFRQVDAGKKDIDLSERDLSTGVRDLLFRLLERDPKRRLQARDVLGHRWIRMHTL